MISFPLVAGNYWLWHKTLPETLLLICMGNDRETVRVLNSKHTIFQCTRENFETISKKTIEL